MTRIIAGEARGRRLAVPSGRGVRPTSDRVREALFSSLGERVVGARVLDLFAGTGALGLEALSRGASAALFVEQSRVVRQVLERNVAAAALGDRAEIRGGDGIKILGALHRDRRVFDIVFCDPPYASDLLEAALASLASAGLVAEGGLIVAEHPRGALPALPKSLRIAETRSYGDTDLSFVERAAPGAA